MAEATSRVQQRRLLMTPTSAVNEIVMGCIGRAQHHYPVQLHGFVFMSNHFHILLTGADARQVASFIGFLKSNIARKLNALNDWGGPFWQRRYRSIPVTFEEAAQVDRLRYLVAHGVKERLVHEVRDWPGASSLPWLLDGQQLEGVWHSRTAEFHGTRSAKRRETVNPDDFKTVHPITMSPLPCWAHLPEREWRSLVSEIVAEVEAELAAEAENADPPLPIMGVAAVIAQHPHRRPPPKPNTPAPPVHAACRFKRDEWKGKLRRTKTAHCAASARFREGDRDVEFPPGTFRPMGGFVPWPEMTGDTTMQAG